METANRFYRLNNDIPVGKAADGDLEALLAAAFAFTFAQAFPMQAMFPVAAEYGLRFHSR